MAVESPPERGGALWLDNWVLGATIAAASSAHQPNPATKLLSPHRSDVWRSTEATSNAFVVFDLGEPRLPGCVALVGSNIDGGVAIRFRGSDNAAQTVGAVFWDLPLYRQDRVGKVLRWYLGAPTSGTAGPRRFWGVRILPPTFGSYNTPDPWFEIGVVWLGEYVTIRPWSPIRIRTRDTSTRTKVPGGAQWSDELPAYRALEVPLGGLTVPEIDGLEAQVRAQGPRHALLDLHAASADPALKRGGCIYGTFPEDLLDGELRSPDANAVTLRFEEAVG